MADGEVLLSLLKPIHRKPMKYQRMVLMTLNNITKSFVLNEQFHPYHQEKERLLESEVICII
ncbi:hypothetical protein BTN50_1562 [Candidatus Enterovibrio altilux]|uniref:Uncharacterized protein n=1 Tax=Candidatus Enterovibrio altilux TaxID=1927128 RepID=A0A291BAM6_9GAMM|nr:hypothetical protein BTN50_1562 [Candidatus Enterovibrio luxaltus]